MLYQLPSIIDSVLILLALMSIVVWGVVIHKWVSFYQLNKRNHLFLEEFSQAEDLQHVRANTKLTDGSLARICQAGLDEWKRLRLSVNAFNHDDRKELVTRPYSNNKPMSNNPAPRKDSPSSPALALPHPLLACLVPYGASCMPSKTSPAKALLDLMSWQVQ